MEPRPQPVAMGVALGTVVSTGVALAAVLWPDRLTPAITAAIIAFANAVIGVVVWWVTQRRVTPIENPALESGTMVNVLQNGEAKGYKATVL